MYLYLKCSIKGGTQNINFKVVNQHKMTCVMCSPWKRTFTLTPLVPLTIFSPTNKIVVYWAKAPLNESLCKKLIFLLIKFVWLKMNNTKGFYVGITFEEEKSNVCFVNAMQVLHFEYLQSNFFL